MTKQDSVSRDQALIFLQTFLEESYNLEPELELFVRALIRKLKKGKGIYTARSFSSKPQESH